MQFEFHCVFVICKHYLQLDEYKSKYLEPKFDHGALKEVKDRLYFNARQADSNSNSTTLVIVIESVQSVGTRGDKTTVITWTGGKTNITVV